MKIFLNREIYASEMIQKYRNELPSNVLSDIGAGFGWLKPYVIKNNLIWQPFDYVRKIEEATIWDLNTHAPAMVEKAGVCVLLEVLEHLPNPLLSIEHIADHMLPGAILILSVPNPRWSMNQLNLLRKGTLYSFQEKYISEHHVFTPWRHIVEFFFKKNNFELLEYHCIQPGVTKIVSFKTFILHLAQKFIEKRDPLTVGWSYGMVLRKKGI